MIKAAVELVDRAGPEGVAYLGSVERNADGSLVDRSVVRDVGEIAEIVDRGPAGRVEQRGDRLVGQAARLDRGRGYAGVRLQRNALESGVEALEPAVHQGNASIVAELQLVES